MVRLRLAGSVLVMLLAPFLHAASPEVAITFDDLPAQRSVMRKLTSAIVKMHVPAIGFVNESKVTTDADTKSLSEWLDSGLELGNHTFSHVDLHATDVAAYEREILEGERITRPLMHDHGKTLQWFRHPYLHTGTSLETRDRVTHFLAARGYRVAPVTLDNSEWIFARAFEKARDGTRKRVGEAYLAYMDEKLAYFEDQSRKLFGRNIRHVLLLHANALNAAWFDDLTRSMQKRGYTFVPIARAVDDPAYDSVDTYAGNAGITWIHRWALSAGKKGAFFAGEPRAPQWIQDLAGIAE